jgi:hypothetical protein
MDLYYGIQIIPFIFTLIHVNSTGWITYNGNLEIVYFIKERLQLNWGIRYIDVNIGSTHIQMTPPELINFANENIPNVNISESSVSEYYALLTLYYTILSLTVAPLLYYMCCVKSHGIQERTHSIVPSYYETISQHSNRALCSKYLFLCQLVKTIIHIGIVSSLFSYMDSETLCLDDVHDDTGVPRLLELSYEDCNYGWQATSFPIALAIDILITIYYGCNIYQSKRSRKNSEQGTELLEV